MSYKDKSQYSHDSRSYHYSANPETQQKHSQVLFKEERKLLSKKYFIKSEQPTKQMSESEVVHNRDKVITSMSQQSQNHQSNTMDSPLVQQNKIQWEKPAQLFLKNPREIKDTSEKLIQEDRVAKNVPCYYAREYQIPKQPKMNIQSIQVGNRNSPIEFSLDEVPKRNQIGDKIGINGLFVKNSQSIKREPMKIIKKGILKKNTELLKQDYLFSQEEENILRNYIQLLGLNVPDVTEFLIKTSNAMDRDPTAIFKMKKNIKLAEDLTEKFHKFRLQNYNNKTISLLPKKTILKNEESKVEQVIPQTQFEMIKNSKKKTVPCVWFHSPQGCHRGDKCDFIHDPDYKGVPTPNMDKYVRPIHELSKNPEMNKRNIQRYKSPQQQQQQQQQQMNYPRMPMPPVNMVPRPNESIYSDNSQNKKFKNNQF